MKVYVLFLFTSLMVAVPREAAAQACPPPEPVATTVQIVEWLDCTLVELNLVWEADIKAAIRQTHPGANSISRLDLEYVSDCDFSPRLEDIDGDDRPEVVLNTRLLIPQLALSQAIFWYIVAPDGAVTPQQHLDYLNNVLLPAVRQDSRSCSRNGANGRYNAVAIPSIFAVNPDQHPLFLGLDSPATRRIGDYVGALPTFFATIHEAGHAVLHLENSAAFGISAEIEADVFAGEVFARSDVPLTLGLGFFLLAYDLDRGGPNADVACRVVELANLAERFDVSAAPELGLQAQYRIGKLRKEYLAQYTSNCED